MAEPKPDRRDVDEAQETLRGLVITGGDPAGILEPVEAAFDQVTQPVERLIHADAPLAGLPHRDHWQGIALLHGSANAIENKSVVDRFAPIRGADGADERLKERPLVVGHQVSCQAGLHRGCQLESRLSRAVNPFCQHGLGERVWLPSSRMCSERPGRRTVAQQQTSKVNGGNGPSATEGDRAGDGSCDHSDRTEADRRLAAMVATGATAIMRLRPEYSCRQIRRGSFLCRAGIFIRLGHGSIFRCRIALELRSAASGATGSGRTHGGRHRKEFGKVELWLHGKHGH